LEAKTASADFWTDQPTAQSTMRKIDSMKNTVQTWRTLEKSVVDLIEMSKLAEEEHDEALEKEIRQESNIIKDKLDSLEFQLILSEPYDERDAIMALHAGAGGTESQDWADILLRMYLRWAERNGFKAELLDSSPGEETGIKSATLNIKGNHAYGYLKAEHGVHRLVRLSPFDSDHARHTSFALIEVLPEAVADTDLQINPGDIKVDTFKSSGPGGQHMQKTSSAIRITHLPSGIVVSCQSQRSQHQNKESALKVLYARLLERERVQKEKEQANLKGERIDAGWGNQIRSYVLHPYKMVKDHRTDYETSNTTAVLDGAIDDFIKAYLRSKVGENE